MNTIDLIHQEHFCQKCGNEIDASDITGLLCSDCWLSQEEAA